MKNVHLDVLLSDKWITELPGKLPTERRLFCFANSGGSALFYESWRQKLPNDWSLCLVELPGRGVRQDEPLITNYEFLLFGVMRAMSGYLDKPYDIFAFSGGGLFGYDVAVQFGKKELPTPSRLILNAVAPLKHFHEVYCDKVKQIEQYHGTDFLDQFKEHFGLEAPNFGCSKEIMAQIGEVLRADSIALSSREYSEGVKIQCPLTAIASKQDALPVEKVKEWKEFTDDKFSYAEMEGGHFEIFNNPLKYLKHIVEPEQK